MTKPLEVTDANFENEVLNSDTPVLVDFWAAWCGPCRIIAPVVEELAADFEGKAKIAKMDVDSNQETAFKYNVRSIPTLIVFKNGEAVDQTMGAQPKSILSDLLNKHV